MVVDEFDDRCECAIFQETVATVVMEYFNDTISSVLLQGQSVFTYERLKVSITHCSFAQRCKTYRIR